MTSYQEKARRLIAKNTYEKSFNSEKNKLNTIWYEDAVKDIKILAQQAYNDGLARGAEIANRISEENGNAYLPSQVADTIREEMKK